MRLLLKRLAIVYVIMGVLCSAAVGLGRLDQTPSNLQTLGFDLCDGEPCYKGMKVGTDWTMVERAFPQGVEKETYELGAPSNRLDLQSVVFFSSDDQKKAESIQITDDSLPISAGDVITQFGIPCYVELGDVPGDMTIIFPKMTVRVQLSTDVAENRQLQFNTPISGLEIHNYRERCSARTDTNARAWRGFSAYRQQ